MGLRKIINGEVIRLRGHDYEIRVVELNFFADEGEPAARVAYLVSDGVIVIERENAAQNLTNAIEDICWRSYERENHTSASLVALLSASIRREKAKRRKGGGNV